MASGAGSPCGACKFLRRKCTEDCVFAPYFCSDQGPARFEAIHKVFGASNVSKLLMHVPHHYRCEAVVTIAYEAQARIRDPVYGCVAHIFALQQQVASLQAQLMQLKAQLAHGSHCWQQSSGPHGGHMSQPCAHYGQPIHHQSSQDHGGVASQMQDMVVKEEGVPLPPPCFKKRAQVSGLGELEDLALRMMRN